jgi:hypothetical protein
MNLREGGGKVPIKNSTQNEATPYLLVDFPTRAEFDVLYSKHSSVDLKDKYWAILKLRSMGNTLDHCGQEYGLTRERVRQIEARFQRLVGKKYRTQTEANLTILSAHRNLLESFLDSEMHEKSLPSDDSH